MGGIIVDSSAPSAPIEPTDVIYMPHRRRLFHEWGVLEGQRTLTLHYGEKEVVFDEPDQIPFGEALLAHARFVAQESTHWALSRPRAWESARDLLEVLVAEGILAVEAPLQCPFAHANEPHAAGPALADDAEPSAAPQLADDDPARQQRPACAHLDGGGDPGAEPRDLRCQCRDWPARIAAARLADSAPRTGRRRASARR
ncbi:MAG: hypothetical protein IPN32_04850 [Deltaproteobacteria bacterium]|nr:hypothetical protein [Deltaproteobacteria bacterium]